MSTIGSIDGAKAGSLLPAGSDRAPTDASPELAKLESQLSDWVNCPSGKTPAGKAHIAQITGQIDAIKVQAKKAAEHRVSDASSVRPVGDGNAAGARLRLDGLGTNLDVRA